MRVQISFLKAILISFILSVVSFQSIAQQKLELPSYRNNDIIVQHAGHTLSYNSRYMTPVWVAYELKASELDGDAQRKKTFSPDPELLDHYNVAYHSDFTNSGWVRGHMVPAGDLKYDQQAMDESFYTSNVCPMNQTFNNGVWKRLEEKIRDWAKTYGTVYVITGPIHDMTKPSYYVGQSRIRVPEKYFKAVLIRDGEQFYSIAFVMTNSELTKGAMKNFAVSVTDIEAITGMTLFVNLKKSISKQIKPQVPLKELGLY